MTDQLRGDFAALGVTLHTNGSEQSAPALIECYPHVVLLALLTRDYRVPYKVSRSGQYWKAEKLTRSERIARLTQRGRLRLICQHLDQGRSLPELAADAGISLRCACKWLGSFRKVSHRITGDRKKGRSYGVSDDKVHVAVDDATRLSYVEAFQHSEEQNRWLTRDLSIYTV